MIGPAFPEIVMDVRYVNPFMAAVRNVFATMVHTEVTAGRPSLRPQENRSADVSGVIGFSGGVGSAG
jgi:chemotaxis protein CheX